MNACQIFLVSQPGFWREAADVIGDFVQAMVSMLSPHHILGIAIIVLLWILLKRKESPAEHYHNPNVPEIRYNDPEPRDVPQQPVQQQAPNPLEGLSPEDAYFAQTLAAEALQKDIADFEKDKQEAEIDRKNSALDNREHELKIRTIKQDMREKFNN